MWVPSDVVGVVATAFDSCAPSVLKLESTLSLGPKTMIATGRSLFRTLRKARAAAVAFWIGAPFMLFEASMRRTAPLFDPPGGATDMPTTGLPFSVTATCDAFSAFTAGSVRRYALSGNPE